MKSYKEFHTLFEKHIQSLQFEGEPRELYDPIRYMLSLGGKRLRPVLVLMANDLFNGKTESAMNAALAVEVFHNFTLVHDDIMDQALIRRGKPTVHAKWNQTVAILSGDLMMIKATELLCAAEHNDLKSLLRLFNETAIGVCEGQQIDMNYETRRAVSTDEYIQMITLKTAVLLGCSLKLGALIANASSEDAEDLYQFGKHIGIAFQVQDDILDSFGDAQTGKKIGGDIASGKKTLLLITALKLADAVTKNELMLLLGKENDAADLKIKSILNIYHKLEVRHEAEKLKEKHLNLAFSFLDKVNTSSEKKSYLRETAIDLMQRMT